MDVRIPYVRKTVAETNTSFVVVNPKSLLTPDLLLHLDASTGLRDSSIRNHPITVNGDATISTAQSVFGGASMLVTAAGIGYLSITDNDGTLAVGTGDFTIDFRIRFFDVTGNQHIVSVSQNSPFFVILKNGLNQMAIVSDVDGTFVTGTTIIGNDTWYHIAVTRQAGDWALFVNGTEEGVPEVHFPDASYGGEDVRIGDGGFNCNAWIDEFRFIKGYAAWTSNFTPPTSPYTTIG